MMTKSKLYNIVQGVKDFRNEFGKEAIKGVWALYWTGTTAKNTYKSFKNEIPELSLAGKTGKILGTGFATTLTIAQAFSWHFIAQDYDCPKCYFAFVPGISNIVWEGIGGLIKKINSKKKIKEEPISIKY